jgi:hypothetical protein
MKIQNFTQSDDSVQGAFEALCKDVAEYVNLGITVIALSHTVTKSEEDRFVATALLCYSDPN